MFPSLPRVNIEYVKKLIYKFLNSRIKLFVSQGCGTEPTFPVSAILL